MSAPIATNSKTLRPVHPFPARMAPSLLWRRLGVSARPIRVLDPMSGSGTTAVISRLRGHHAIAIDSDPLALLIARAWCSDVDAVRLRNVARQVLDTAKVICRELRVRNAYPENADAETRSFVRYWFDPGNRKQLAALCLAINNVKRKTERTLLWCALSRLIITKKSGVSLAMDTSHSRPHKVYETAPIKPFNHFLQAVENVLKGNPFLRNTSAPAATVQEGDARSLPIRTGSIDLVITSPPYLNAIDYLRGHKLSLVWMGHSLRELRDLRSDNIGTELAASELIQENEDVRRAIARMGRTEQLTNRVRGMLARYVFDMDQVVSEIRRVLKRDGKAIIVIGDSTIKGTFVRNSRALTFLAKKHGLTLCCVRRRPLKENRRYLPPPQRQKAGAQLQARMREEVILTFQNR